MLEIAIADYKNGRDHNPSMGRGRLSRDAESWLFDPSRPALVRFDDVCAMLGVEPEVMRARIRKMVGLS